MLGKSPVFYMAELLKQCHLCAANTVVTLFGIRSHLLNTTSEKLSNLSCFSQQEDEKTSMIFFT